jgi:hypothetical protein
MNRPQGTSPTYLNRVVRIDSKYELAKKKDI